MEEKIHKTSDEVFHKLQFLKYISYDDHLFLGNVSYLMEIADMEQKIQKIFLIAR